MFKRFGVIFLVLFFIGCATVPPESILVQEKISRGLLTARDNQEKLIIAGANSEYKLRELSFRIALPTVLKNEFGTKNTYTREELETVTLKFSSQLQDEMRIIEEKKLKLLKENEEFFRTLKRFSDMNLRVLRNTSNLSDSYMGLWLEISEEATRIITEGK